MPKEHPIIMSAFSIRAILDGRKTQTRRVVKPQPPEGAVPWGQNPPGTWWFCDAETWPDAEPTLSVRCPYGVPGDRLWVRETWQLVRECGNGPDTWIEEWRDKAIPKSWPESDNGSPWLLSFRADENPWHYSTWHSTWHPSIHMPRWASRITLEVTGVRVERVQDISKKDAIAEGIYWSEAYPEMYTWDGHKSGYGSAKLAFAALWDSIYAKRGWIWDNNLWVWVVEFKQVTP